MIYDTLREALAAVAAAADAARFAVISSGATLYTPGGYREYLERHDPALLASPVLLAWGDYADPERGSVWAYVWRWREDRTYYGAAGSGDKPVCTVEAVHATPGEGSI